MPQLSDFRKKLIELPRQDLIEIIKDQDPEIAKGVRRIEWVFENKLRHLTWPDGTQIADRPMTNQELALLIDEPFQPNDELTKMGLKVEDQEQIHIASDPVLWAKHILKATPRAYQVLMLRDPSLRKVLRAGRRLGKTYTLALVLLHYSWTHEDGRCIVVAPMKSHVELIYQEVMRLAKKSPLVKQAITRHVTSPQFMIEFSTGSTIRFFTSGIRSGGKADVVRGQEAHIIVLDELDYMHNDDLESLYAMLQKTAEDQPDKLLIGASTPTGRREQFWKWCNSSRFREFWFPSYCNPFFNRDAEEEFHLQYSEMGYRHEIEADWGEDTEGVYPRRYVDLAFKSPGWEYKSTVTSARSFFVFGVDWDKYGAGTNIVVLEVCQEDYEDPLFAGRVKLAYREEIPKEEYTLTKAVQRIIELNKVFNPRHIYVDRGFGEVQVELLHKHGVEHPESQLRKRVVGVSFSETLEIYDPHTKQKEKKDLKPYMIDVLRQMLEREAIVFPANDEDEFRDNSSLYLQLISYVVLRVTPTGRPVFEAAGTAQDHAHDALVLATLAIDQNYGEFMRLNLARRARAVSNEAFLPTFQIENDAEEEMAKEAWGDLNSAPINHRRSLTVRMNRRNPARPIRRKSF